MTVLVGETDGIQFLKHGRAITGRNSYLRETNIEFHGCAIINGSSIVTLFDNT